MSLVGPKARPQGVVDGCQVDIPEPGTFIEYVRTLVRGQSRRWLSALRGNPQEWNLRGKRTVRNRGRENPRRSLYSTVPQTDTGGRVEDTKAFEITLAKELGKMAP